jgi:hypothetical protein
MISIIKTAESLENTVSEFRKMKSKSGLHFYTNPNELAMAVQSLAVICMVAVLMGENLGFSYYMSHMVQVYGSFSLFVYLCYYNNVNIFDEKEDKTNKELNKIITMAVLSLSIVGIMILIQYKIIDLAGFSNEKQAFVDTTTVVFMVSITMIAAMAINYHLRDRKILQSLSDAEKQVFEKRNELKDLLKDQNLLYAMCKYAKENHLTETKELTETLFRSMLYGNKFNSLSDYEKSTAYKHKELY